MFPLSNLHSNTRVSLQIDSIRIPTSIQKALKYENWIQAMNEEISALEMSETWEIKRYKSKAKGCMWKYMLKYRSNYALD